MHRATLLLASAAATAGTFIFATDLSFLPRLDCGGACSPFSTAAGAPADALAAVAAAGFSHVRVRLWVDPSASTPGGWPDGDARVSNLTSVCALAARAARAGLALWLDLHYSDTWADPGHQGKPRAWAALAPAALRAAVAGHTGAALAALAAAGAPPAVVQVGNEVTRGLLWEPTGGACGDGGYIGAGCAGDNWAAAAALVAAGAAAVRAHAPQALVMVHTDLGNRLNETGDPAAAIVAWYERLAAAGAADWDAIGLSFYPQWGAGPTRNLAKLAALRAAFPGKLLAVAETAWANAGAPARGDEFARSPAGQRAYLEAAVAAARAAGAGAVAWWGAEYYRPPFPGAGPTAFWGEDGRALDVIAAPLALAG